MPRQKKHESRKIEAAATKYKPFRHHAAVDRDGKTALRAQRASGRSAGEKKKPPRKPCGGSPESILFYLSYPLCRVQTKDLFGHSARIPGGEGAKAPQRSVAVFPPTRDAAGKGAQKAQPRPFATPYIKKRNVLSQERSFYSFSAFSALCARFLHPLTARAPFLPSGVRRKFSSFRTARRAFFSSFRTAWQGFFFLTAAF